MYIAGTGITPFQLNILPGFKPETELALKWIQTSNGNYYATDRGASSDVYNCSISTYGKEDEINNFLNEIESNRLSDSHIFAMYGFNSGEKIFGADIDYSGYLGVTIIEISDRVQKTWKGFRLDLKLRSLSPSFIGTASFPSLLHLDIGYTGTARLAVNKFDSYTGSFTYADDESNTGIFEGTFFFTDTEMKNARRYIATQRGSNFTISGINGVTYPFGPTRGTFPITAKLIKWEDMGQAWNDHWKMKLRFAEVV
jgi:hypothetical protein